MIGQMDQRVTIQRSTAASDGIGGLTLTWGAYRSVWAKLTSYPRKAGESMIEGRVTATQIVGLRIYTIPDLTEKDRVLWNGRLLGIRSVIIGSTRSLFMDLICEAGAAQ